eukprot:m.147748 g.147748  ORF g.147748 m.147748 type:complete len:152 (+) comp38474_c0_seq3:202-657(+)
MDMAEMDTDADEVTVLALIIRRRCKRRRRMWVRKIFQKRKEQGDYHALLQEMRLSDRDAHFSYLRMSKETFDVLMDMVEPRLKRRSYRSSRRPEISAAERLALTIRFLATGNSQQSISFSYRVGKSTVCGIVRETCAAIWESLQPLCVRAG